MLRKIFYLLGIIVVLVFATAVISDAQRMVDPVTGKSYPISATPPRTAVPTFGQVVIPYAFGSNWLSWQGLMFTPADSIPTRTLAVSGMLTRYDSTGTCDKPLAGAVRGVALVDNSSRQFANITTNASAVVFGDKMVLGKVIVNVAGTTSTVALYNDCTSPCDSNYVCTLQTTATGLVELNHTFSSCLCAATAGATAADISLLYRVD